MKFALVILETPKSISHEAEQAWTNTISFSRDRTQKSGKVQILNDGCYLCDLSNGLFDLSYI